MPTTPPTLPPLPAVVRPLTTEQSRWLQGRFPDLPTSPSRCVTCRGDGAFRWRAYDEAGHRLAETAEYVCPCEDQYILHRFLLHAGVGLAYQRLEWDDYTEAVPQAVLDYLGSAERYISRGVGCILYGSIGSGKSLLAALMLKALLGEGHDGYFTTFSSLLDTYAGGWQDREEQAWFTRRIRNAGVLVVDDVGRERKRQTVLTRGERERTGAPSGVVRTTSQHAETVFEEVVRHRVANSKPTVLTTNLDLTQLTEGYGGHVMSLLRESSATACFGGGDYRDHARLRLLDEVDAGLTRPVLL